MILTPFIRRTERPHGLGRVTYDQENTVLTENICPQSSPDPIRYGNTPARPSRRTFAFMQLNIAEWGSGFAGDFIGEHPLLPMRQRPPQQLNIRAQNAVGERPNITRPPAVAYGSLFSLQPPTYDLAGNH